MWPSHHPIGEHLGFCRSLFGLHQKDCQSSNQLNIVALAWLDRPRLKQYCSKCELKTKVPSQRSHGSGGDHAFWEAPFRNVCSNLINLTLSFKTNNKNEACILCVCLHLFHFSDHSFLWYFLEALAHDRLEIKPESCNTKKSEDSNTAGSGARELF